MCDIVVCTSVRLPDQLNEEIEEELDYGECKGDWIIEACRERLRDDRRFSASTEE